MKLKRDELLRMCRAELAAADQRVAAARENLAIAERAAKAATAQRVRLRQIIRQASLAPASAEFEYSGEDCT